MCCALLFLRLAALASVLAHLSDTHFRPERLALVTDTASVAWQRALAFITRQSTLDVTSTGFYLARFGIGINMTPQGDCQQPSLQLATRIYDACNDALLSKQDPTPQTIVYLISMDLNIATHLSVLAQTPLSDGSTLLPQDCWDTLPLVHAPIVVPDIVSQIWITLAQPRFHVRLPTELFTESSDSTKALLAIVQGMGGTQIKELTALRHKIIGPALDCLELMISKFHLAMIAQPQLYAMLRSIEPAWVNQLRNKTPDVFLSNFSHALQIT